MALRLRLKEGQEFGIQNSAAIKKLTEMDQLLECENMASEEAGYQTECGHRIPADVGP